MLRIASNSSMRGIGFTDYEEDILFDVDDPDFQTTNGLPCLFRDCNDILQQSTFSTMSSVANMSLVGIHHPRNVHSNHSSLSSLSYSLDDIATCCSPHFNSEHVMTIEELRLQMSSCFSCGVSWAESHVSLDCSECGGYALERPCPTCEGACGAVWKRELTKSHASSKAHWEGECKRQKPQNASSVATSDVSRKDSSLSSLSPGKRDEKAPSSLS